MNAYRLDIWQGLKHNDTFVQNSSRTLLIHARNEQEARWKISLRKGYVKEYPQLKITVSDEWIYSCYKIGQVRIERFYVYPDKYSPILVSEYQRNIKKELKVK